MILYRIEDQEGRGPFRPGLSNQWRDSSGLDLPPPWVEAGMSLFDFQRLFSDRAIKRGVACKTREQLYQWFSRSERRRLKRLGFREVEIADPHIVLETDTQVVFEIVPPLRAWA